MVHGAPAVGCTFLTGDTPGNYSCELVEQHPELKEDMAIGAGCPSTLFNEDREKTKERLKVSVPPADRSVGGHDEATQPGHEL
jgi:hypothetical protein